MSQGKLHVVATPIGNLGDITERAAQTLAKVAGIAAEDTRRTRELLTHLGIRGVKLTAIDAHASESAIDRLLDRMLEGEDLACVTDAGTPSVSDPGTDLVRRAIARGIEVVAVPGPSAVTAAIAVSGLVDGPFLFLGFLPRRGKKRDLSLERVAETAEPVIVFEAANRTRRTLEDLAKRSPRREVAVCREMTKRYEQTIRGTLEKLAVDEEPYRGEVTIILGPIEHVLEELDDDAIDEEIASRLDAGATPKELAAELAERTGRPKRIFYNRAQKLRAGGD